MRLRRSLFFIAPATPAGRPSRRNPGETVKALPGRPGWGGCGLPGAPKLPQAAAPEARLSCRKEWPAIARLPSCRKSSARIKAFPAAGPSPQATAARATPHETRITNHGLYGRSVGRWCARVAQPKTAAQTAAPAAQSMLPCSLLPTIARNFPEFPGSFLLLACSRLRRFVGDCAQLCSMGGSLVAPEQVSAHRPPFSVGLTTSTVCRSSSRPPGCFRCGERKRNPC